MRRSWTDRFLLIFLGDPIKKLQFDTKLLKHSPILFNGKPEENWSQDRESWEKLLGVLQKEYVSASTEELVNGGYSRSRVRIGNRWTSVTDLRGRSYAIKITENTTQTNLIPSSWHDLTVCGMAVRKTGSSLALGNDGTPISEPCVIQSQGTYFAPTKRMRTSSDHASNIRSSLYQYSSDRSPTFASNSPELFFSNSLSGLSVSASALNTESSPSCGRLFWPRHYNDSFKIEEAEEGDSAPSAFEDRSVASDEDEMCLPKPRYLTFNRSRVSQRRRFKKTGKKLRRDLNCENRQKAKSFGDSLDKPPTYIPIVHRIKSKASELLQLHPKEDKFGKKTRNTLGETLVSLANVSTEILSIHPPTESINKAASYQDFTSQLDHIRSTKIVQHTKLSHAGEHFVKLTDDPSNVVCAVKPHDLGKNQGHAKSYKVPVEFTSVSTAPDFCSHKVDNHSSESAAFSPEIRISTADNIFSIPQAEHQKASLLYSTDVVYASPRPIEVSLHGAQRGIDEMDRNVAGSKQHIYEEGLFDNVSHLPADTGEDGNSFGTENRGCLHDKPDSRDLIKTICNFGSDVNVAAIPEGLATIPEKAHAEKTETPLDNHSDDSHTGKLDVHDYASELSASPTAQNFAEHIVIVSNPNGDSTVTEDFQTPLRIQPIYDNIPLEEEHGLISFESTPLYTPPLTATKNILSGEQENVPAVFDDMAQGRAVPKQPDSKYPPASKTTPTEESGTNGSTEVKLDALDKSECDHILLDQTDASPSNYLPLHTLPATNDREEQDGYPEYTTDIFDSSQVSWSEQIIPSFEPNETEGLAVSPDLITPSIVRPLSAVPNHLIGYDPPTASSSIQSAEEKSHTSSHYDSTNNLASFSAHSATPNTTNIVTYQQSDLEALEKHLNSIPVIMSTEESSQVQADEIVYPRDYQVCQQEPTRQIDDCKRDTSTHIIHQNVPVKSLTQGPTDVCCNPDNLNTAVLMQFQPTETSSVVNSSLSTENHNNTTVTHHQPISRLPEEHSIVGMQLVDEMREINTSVTAMDEKNKDLAETVTKQTSKSKLTSNQVIKENDGTEFSQNEPVQCLTTAPLSDNRANVFDLQLDEASDGNKPYEEELSKSPGGHEALTTDNARTTSSVSYVVREGDLTHRTEEHHAADTGVLRAEAGGPICMGFELPTSQRRTVRFLSYEWWKNRLPLTRTLQADEYDMQASRSKGHPTVGVTLQSRRDAQIASVLPVCPDTDLSNATAFLHFQPNIPHAEHNAGSVDDSSAQPGGFAEILSPTRSNVLSSQKRLPDPLSQEEGAPIKYTETKLPRTPEGRNDRLGESHAPCGLQVTTNSSAERYDNSTAESARFEAEKELEGITVSADSETSVQRDLQPLNGNSVRELEHWNFGAPVSAVYFVILYLPSHLYSLYNTTFDNVTDVLTAMADRGLRLAICWSLIQNALRNPFCVAVIFVAFTSASSRIRHWPRLIGSFGGISDVYLLAPPARSDPPGLSYWSHWIGETRLASQWRGRAQITNFSRYPWSLVNPAD